MKLARTVFYRNLVRVMQEDRSFTLHGDKRRFFTLGKRGRGILEQRRKRWLSDVLDLSRLFRYQIHDGKTNEPRIRI